MLSSRNLAWKTACDDAGSVTLAVQETSAEVGAPKVFEEATREAAVLAYEAWSGIPYTDPVDPPIG